MVAYERAEVTGPPLVESIEVAEGKAQQPLHAVDAEAALAQRLRRSVGEQVVHVLLDPASLEAGEAAEG